MLRDDRFDGNEALIVLPVDTLILLRPVLRALNWHDDENARVVFAE